MFSTLEQGKRHRGGKGSIWHQKLRDKWTKDPRCHWCKAETVLDNERGSAKPNPLMATLDHLYSNLDLRRLLDGGKKTVVACLKCNNKRSAHETRKVYPNSYDKRNNKISLVKILKDCK